VSAASFIRKIGQETSVQHEDGRAFSRPDFVDTEVVLTEFTLVDGHRS